jgi:hypothetical protein
MKKKKAGKLESFRTRTAYNGQSSLPLRTVALEESRRIMVEAGMETLLGGRGLHCHTRVHLHGRWRVSFCGTVVREAAQAWWLVVIPGERSGLQAWRIQGF